MSKKIQVLKPKFRVEECLAAIRECLELGWPGLGFKTTEFENAWKRYTGLPNAHFVNSATAGLHLAVKIFKDAFGWQHGDEIITTPLTFVSTNHTILYEGLFPSFADVNSDTLCLDPVSVEAKITPRTRAVMYVGVGGNPGQLREIHALCKKYNLKLILDAAHMAGTELEITPDVVVYSFQAVKNLPTADSGMVCFQDAEFDAKARKLSWLGIDKDTYLRSSMQGDYKWKYDVPEVGFKYHGNSIMAAIGLVQLQYLDADNNERNRLFDRYRFELAGWSLQVRIIDPHEGEPIRLATHLCQVVVENRDEVIMELNKRDICPGVHYIDNTHYRMYRYGMNTCPVAHDLSNKLLTLPLHLEMTDDDVTKVCSALKEIFSGS